MKYFIDKRPSSIPRMVGIELEICDHQPENGDLRKWRSDWKAVIGDDGSITSYYGNGNTAELKTSPASGRFLIEQVTEMCEALKSAKARVNKTCGLHVHVDARDFSKGDLAKVIMYWPKVQTALFRKVSKYRKHSRWCNPRQLHSDQYLIDSCKNSPEEKLFKHNLISYVGGLGERYSALNLQALQKHHTFENRMHQATLDPEKIIKWAKFNSNFIETVKNSSYEDLENTKLAKELLRILK